MLFLGVLTRQCSGMHCQEIQNTNGLEFSLGMFSIIFQKLVIPVGAFLSVHLKLPESV